MSELLREIVEQGFPADPWRYVEITTESYQPEDECGWCGRVKPRLKKDRGLDAHDTDCLWVKARAALADTQDGALDLDAAAQRAVHLIGNYLWNEDGENEEWLIEAHDTLAASLALRATPPPQPGEPA